METPFRIVRFRSMWLSKHSVRLSGKSNIYASSLEIEKEALAHGVDAVFPKQDDPTALAENARALYDLMGS